MMKEEETDMTDFTKGKVSEMPSTKRGARRSGVAQAIRELEVDDALFIPAKDGQALQILQLSRSANTRKVAGPGIYSTRRDIERNGVWVFLRDGAA